MDRSKVDDSIKAADMAVGTKIRHSRLLTKLVSGLVIGIIFYLPLAGEEKCSYTNLEIMSQVIENAVQMPFDKLQVDSTRTLLVEMTADDPVMQFLHMHIVRIFRDQGWNVFVQSDSFFRGVKIVWYPFEISMQYPERIQRGIFRTSRIVRKASCHLFMEVVSFPQGKVLWSGSLSAQKQDTVAASMISEIEMNGLILGHPTVPRATSLFKLFEPMAMLAGAAVLGYLFYVIRS